MQLTRTKGLFLIVLILTNTDAAHRWDGVVAFGTYLRNVLAPLLLRTLRESSSNGRKDLLADILALDAKKPHRHEITALGAVRRLLSLFNKRSPASELRQFLDASAYATLHKSPVPVHEFEDSVIDNIPSTDFCLNTASDDMDFNFSLTPDDLFPDRNPMLDDSIDDYDSIFPTDCHSLDISNISLFPEKCFTLDFDF